MGKKILVVDDHPGIRLLLLEIFTYEGYNVTMAVNGQEAIDLLKKEVFNLVVLDRYLPVLNGIQVVEQIAADKNKADVIFVSGMTAGLAEETAAYDFVKAIVEKPFNIDDLYAIVKKVIQ